MARKVNRCQSCKKLKIKCSETKPACEYCASTGRKCVYLEVAQHDSRSAAPPKKVRKVIPKDRFPDWAIDVALRVRHDVTLSLENTVYDYKLPRKPSQITLVDSRNNIPNQTGYPLVGYYPTPELSLFCASSQLQVNQFELRLLHFFQHYCLPLFSKNANKVVGKVWKEDVPILWNKSKLLRMSVYSFSAMNLWPLCDLQELANTSIVEAERLFPDAELSNSHDNTNSVGSIYQYGAIIDPNASPRGGNLYIKTINYFSKTLSLSISSMGKLVDDELNNTVRPNSLFKAAETLVAGMLVFSFLGMHPHRLVPLVSFKADPEDPETDLLRICDGLRVVFLTNITTLLNSPYAGLFRQDECFEISGPKVNYPIIENLRFRLEDESESMHYAIYKEGIDSLELCLYRAITLNYAVPLFRWILMQEEIANLVRQKDEFALKILFTFASYCNLSRFHLFSRANMWLDFLQWYKEFNFERHGEGNWKDLDDMFLHECVVGRRTVVVEIANLGMVDPYAAGW